MLKRDEKILEHLAVYNTGLSDTYFCSIYYKNKERFILEENRFQGGSSSRPAIKAATIRPREIVKVRSPCKCRRVATGRCNVV